MEGEPFPTPNEDDTNNPLFYLRRALGWQNNISRAGRELANLCRRVQFGCDRVPEIPQWRIPHPICPSRCKTNLFEIICNNYIWLADKCLERQMPGRTNACTGICPPVGQMPRRTNAWRGQMPRWTNAWTCGFRHLSSWHLSGPNVGSGICPPGICPGQMWVQAFVLLAFVRK